MGCRSPHGATLNVNVRMSTAECQRQNVNVRMSMSECQCQNVNVRMSTSECQRQNVNVRMSELLSSYSSAKRTSYCVLITSPDLTRGEDSTGNVCWSFPVAQRLPVWPTNVREVTHDDVRQSILSELYQ
ncbi:hypothetical protein Btru_037412 [Bulinus truncatus]|nr:hypothetical protein Btru_037412 [Bulinus truncatus]